MNQTPYLDALYPQTSSWLPFGLFRILITWKLKEIWIFEVHLFSRPSWNSKKSYFSKSTKTVHINLKIKNCIVLARTFSTTFIKQVSSQVFFFIFQKIILWFWSNFENPAWYCITTTTVVYSSVQSFPPAELYWNHALTLIQGSFHHQNPISPLLTTRNSLLHSNLRISVSFTPLPFIWKSYMINQTFWIHLWTQNLIFNFTSPDYYV